MSWAQMLDHQFVHLCVTVFVCIIAAGVFFGK